MSDVSVGDRVKILDHDITRKPVRGKRVIKKLDAVSGKSGVVEKLTSARELYPEETMYGEREMIAQVLVDGETVSIKGQPRRRNIPVARLRKAD